MASTVAAAEAALLAAIQARPAMSGVATAWGEAADLPQDAELVRVDDAREVRRSRHAFGEFEETYLLQVHIDTFAAGGTILEAKTRLWALVDEVEGAVLADTSLGGIVADITPDSVIPTTVPYDAGWWAQADVLFACRVFGSP